MAFIKMKQNSRSRKCPIGNVARSITCKCKSNYIARTSKSVFLKIQEALLIFPKLSFSRLLNFFHISFIAFTSVLQYSIAFCIVVLLFGGTDVP